VIAFHHDTCSAFLCTGDWSTQKTDPAGCVGEQIGATSRQHWPAVQFDRLSTFRQPARLLTRHIWSLFRSFLT